MARIDGIFSMNNDSYFIDQAENDMGKCLVLKAPWSDDFIDIIKKENIAVLRISDSMGWKGADISFFEKLQSVNLCGVEVYSWAIKDITPLKFIPSLEYLGLQCDFTKAPDFSIFSELKIFKVLWRPKATTVFNCKGLKLLNIVNYPAEDFHDLKNIVGLTRLQIVSRRLASLAGIESLQSLRILDLAECPKLVSLSGIEKCQALQAIELESCKKVGDVSMLGEVAGLRSLVLTDCGRVQSLKSLANCRFLESLNFPGDTNVEDGELTPLLGMPSLKRMWFSDRQHYSHKRAQVEALLS